MSKENNLKTKYLKEIKPLMAKELNVKSIMEVPKLKKIVINMGLGKAINDKSIVNEAVEELTQIVGQKAVKTYARVSNASFKIREGMPIGVKVTLRGKKMYEFLDKVINVSLPRIRDFRGISPKSFDGRGNYTFGIKEFIIFPEISLDKVKHMKGCDINIVTDTNSNDKALQLLKHFGMPFKKNSSQEVKNG